MLFDPGSHEPLVEDAWNPAVIRSAIRKIVDDAEAAFDDGWPTYPLDDEEPRRFRTVYLGGAGVIRALDDLARRGLAELRRACAVGGERGAARGADHANARDERRELMWGSPGTMLAAAALGGRPLAGCVLALAGGGADVDGRAAAVTRRYAVEEDGLANWPPLADGGLRPPDGRIRVQWCHGAPGIVASLARWHRTTPSTTACCVPGRARLARGPAREGAGLCHGTAGNGYAFLALLEPTGDKLWLERARAFAMHAEVQVARDRTAYGRGRYTLWTGDPGTALYSADCLAGSGSVPLP